VAVITAPEKDFFEEAEVAGYAKIFSSHLCQQRQLFLQSSPFSRHFD